MNQSQSFDSDAAWDFLSELIDQFCTQWEAAPPEPDFAGFAERLNQIDDAEFRRIGLIELVKVEFEFRRTDESNWRKLAWYLDQWPELGLNGAPPSELVAEERRLRPNSGFGNHDPSLLKDFEPEMTLALHHARDAHKFQPGDSIDDFDLLAKLGRGAFASVFLARQVSMQRLVALKISADEGHEGATLAKLNHPHVVRVYDQRVDHKNSLRLMYMEYVAGGTLNDVIKQAAGSGVPLDSILFLETLDEKLADAGISPPAESVNRENIAAGTWPRTVARIGAQLAEAVEYTHGEGILHRDIKPANVLLDAHGYPKLVDFNISYGDQVIGATAASCFGGSLAYMSREQLEAFHPQNPLTANQINEACDVYSLGVTLCELLTGERPFTRADRGDPIEMLDQLIEQRKGGLSHEQLTRLTQEDHLLGTAIAKALETEPEDRADVASLRRLLRWAADQQVSNYLKSPHGKWNDWRAAVCNCPLLFIFGTVFGVSIVATLFVIKYNVSESVSPEGQDLFLSTRQIINRTVYPVGLVFLLSLFWKTRKVLRDGGANQTEEQLSQAIESNLEFGHRAALMCVAIWSVAGLMFPIALSFRGAGLEPMAWADFSISHLLAGLISGAFVFFGLTLLSTTTWHSRLVMAASRQGAFADTRGLVKKIRSRVYWYRVIAIGAPLVAIAMLANFRAPVGFAVSFLSVAAIAGLVAMANAIRRIGKSLELIERI